MPRHEYTAAHGASALDFLPASKFAEEHELEPKNASVSSRNTELQGTSGQLSLVFSVKLDKVRLKEQVFRRRTGDVTAPESLIPAGGSWTRQTAGSDASISSKSIPAAPPTPHLTRPMPWRW
jgi:hypothetical protein